MRKIIELKIKKKRFLCWIGIHKWKRYREDTGWYNTENRVCLCCPKSQYRDPHTYWVWWHNFRLTLKRKYEGLEHLKE